MQGMRDPVFDFMPLDRMTLDGLTLDRMLRRRQCLAEHLPAEHLGAPDVAAVAAEDVVLDPLQLEQRDQVVENRMHGSEPARHTSVRPPSTAMPVPLTNTASSLARNRITFATSTGSPTRPAAECAIQ